MRHPPEQIHRCESTTLSSGDKVVISYSIDDRKDAYRIATNPQTMRDPTNGYTEFQHGIEALDMLNVIETFQRTLLYTPLRIYCDKWDGFNKHWQNAFGADTEHWATDAGTGWSNNSVWPRPRQFGYSFKCGQHGTEPQAQLSLSGSSLSACNLQLTIDLNWLERVRDIGLALHWPQATSQDQKWPDTSWLVLQTKLNGIYRRDGFNDPEAMMQLLLVRDRHRVRPFQRIDRDQGFYVVGGYPIGLENSYVIGTPSRGWRSLRDASNETSRPISHRISELVPEQAADMFEERDEPALAKALRLESGYFKKSQL